MEALELIRNELRTANELRSYYEKSITDLQTFSKEQPTETARLINAMSRGIKRIDKENKIRNKQLDKLIDDIPDEQYVHSEPLAKGK